MSRRGTDRSSRRCRHLAAVPEAGLAPRVLARFAADVDSGLVFLNDVRVIFRLAPVNFHVSYL